MNALRKLLTHASMILSLAALTLCALDGINPQMGFLSSGIGRRLIGCSAVIAIAAGISCALRR